METTPMSRIVVETETDWLRIKENVTNAIRHSVEARLASLPGGKDGESSRAVRQEVESRIARVQEEMWKMSAPNLRVNGHDYEEFVEATEAFDETLDRKIWALNAERVPWETTVAELRKQRPALVYRLEDDLERRRTVAEWLPEGEDDEELERKSKKRAVELPKPERHEQVIETFTTVVSNLKDLAASAPAQLSRAQRAQNVQEEIANMPR